MQCSRKETDCFARAPGGECSILTDTLFSRPGGCNFYKTSNYDYSAPITDRKTLDYPGRWKAVLGYEGAYLVSDRGQVLNRWRNPITPKKGKDGRLCVQLIKGNSAVRHYLDDLVADAFIGGKGEVGYKDGNKRNCNAENLYRR